MDMLSPYVSKESEFLNLNNPDSAALLTNDNGVLETSMDDIEIQIVKDYLKNNRKFMEE